MFRISIKKKALVTLIISAIGVGLFAQDGRELTLEDCLELARTRNFSLLKSNMVLDKAKDRETGNWSYFLPSLSASGSATFYSDPLQDHPKKIDDNPYLSAGLTATLNLTSSLPLVIRANRLAYQREEISREQALFNLNCLVEQSFYELIARKKDLAIQKDNLDLAGKEYDLIIADYVNGRISELSVFQSQVSYENLRPRYHQAQIDYQNDLRTFLTVLGLDLETPVTLKGDLTIEILDELNPRELIDAYLYSRPDVQKAVNAGESRRNDYLLTLMQKRLPQLSLSARWSTANLAEDGALENEDWTGSGSITLALRIPLDNYIPYSQGDLAVRSAKTDGDIQDITLRETLRNGELQIYNAVDTLNNLTESLKVSELRAELAQVNYELSDQGFRNGVTDQVTLEKARINLLDAQQSHLGTQLRYKIALLNLSKALNLLDRTELNR